MDSGAAIVHIVDDDADVRSSLARMLRIGGYQAVGSASAHDFLLKPPGESASCVILDLTLPGIDGLQLQRLMGEAGDRRPVLFLTGTGDVASGVLAMKAGAVDFLTKPVDIDEMLRAVGEALGRSAAERERRRATAAISERVASLTSREREVLELVIGGHPNKRTALFLGIAEKTVKIHRGRVMAKLGVDSVAELVRTAAAVGITHAEPCAAPVA